VFFVCYIKNNFVLMGLEQKCYKIKTNSLKEKWPNLKHSERDNCLLYFQNNNAFQKNQRKHRMSSFSL